MSEASNTPTFDALTSIEQRAVDHWIETRDQQETLDQTETKPNINDPKVLGNLRESIAKGFNDPESSAKETVTGHYERHLAEMASRADSMQLDTSAILNNLATGHGNDGPAR